jgi:hypothetical protein
MAADNLDRSVTEVMGYRLDDQGSIPGKRRELSDYPAQKRTVTACGVNRDEVQGLYRGVMYFRHAMLCHGPHVNARPYLRNTITAFAKLTGHVTGTVGTAVGNISAVVP